MNTVRDLLSQSHIFAGLPAAVLDEVAGCGRLDQFESGASIIHVGEPAATFHVIRHGRVSIQLAAPGREPLTVATRDEGDAIGWSWLFKPYRWHFDAIAAGPVRVIALDGECLRGKCAVDHELGYHVMSRFADFAIRDLELTQLQLLDVYGHVGVR
jgi:CRP/FNR family transcriptional regulator, cyclic AMP receptor protein